MVEPFQPACASCWQLLTPGSGILYSCQHFQCSGCAAGATDAACLVCGNRKAMRLSGPLEGGLAAFLESPLPILQRCGEVMAFQCSHYKAAILAAGKASASLRAQVGALQEQLASANQEIANLKTRLEVAFSEEAGENSGIYGGSRGGGEEAKDMTNPFPSFLGREKHSQTKTAGSIADYMQFESCATPVPDTTPGMPPREENISQEQASSTGPRIYAELRNKLSDRRDMGSYHASSSLEAHTTKENHHQSEVPTRCYRIPSPQNVPSVQNSTFPASTKCTTPPSTPDARSLHGYHYNSYQEASTPRSRLNSPMSPLSSHLKLNAEGKQQPARGLLAFSQRGVQRPQSTPPRLRSPTLPYCGLGRLSAGPMSPVKSPQLYQRERMQQTSGRGNMKGRLESEQDLEGFELQRKALSALRRPSSPNLSACSGLWQKRSRFIR